MELKLANGQDCCSTVFMPSASLGTMPDQHFTVGAIKLFFETQLVGGRHTEGQSHLCE